jgi:hypothetical protein
VLDVADPARPVEVGFYPVFLESLAANGPFIYVGAGGEGLQVFRFTGFR